LDPFVDIPLETAARPFEGDTVKEERDPFDPLDALLLRAKAREFPGEKRRFKGVFPPVGRERVVPA
jgi:hypothetical protein